MTLGFYVHDQHDDGTSCAREGPFWCSVPRGARYGWLQNRGLSLTTDDEPAALRRRLAGRVLRVIATGREGSRIVVHLG